MALLRKLQCMNPTLNTNINGDMYMNTNVNNTNMYVNTKVSTNGQFRAPDVDGRGGEGGGGGGGGGEEDFATISLSSTERLIEF